MDGRARRYGIAMHHTPLVDIIIPTLDNRRYLEPCLASIAERTEGVHYRVIVVNNGQAGSCDYAADAGCLVLEAGGNRGWEGGLQLGLQQSTAAAVLFLNDDTLILRTQRAWLSTLLADLRDPVAAVGPSSNLVAGAQALGWSAPASPFAVTFLIGFCLLVRRDALDAVGGVDAALPGGDDIDLSIRLRRAGYTLLCDRRVFIWHHGFKTGARLYGASTQPGGWNSREYTERVAHALIAKHGAAAVNETWGTIIA